MNWSSCCIGPSIFGISTSPESPKWTEDPETISEVAPHFPYEVADFFGPDIRAPALIRITLRRDLDHHLQRHHREQTAPDLARAGMTRTPEAG